MFTPQVIYALEHGVCAKWIGFKDGNRENRSLSNLYDTCIVPPASKWEWVSVCEAVDPDAIIE